MSLTIAILVMLVAAFAVASSMFRPNLPIETLYSLYKAADMIMPLTAVAFMLFFGGTWLLVSRNSDRRRTFNEVFRDNQSALRVVGVVIFGLFLMTGARAVKRNGEAWEFTGKAGQTVITVSDAREQMWQNIRWDSLGALFGSFLIGYGSICLESTRRVLRQLEAGAVR